jgi:type III restriction enzyme
MLVNNPILNSSFEEPVRYWAYEEGQPVLREGRRPAGYYLAAGKIQAGPSSCD